MKSLFVLLATIILPFSHSFCQDQIKTKYTGKVLRVHIKEITGKRMLYSNQDNIEKSLHIDDIDSISTSNEKLINDISSIQALEGRLVKTNLVETEFPTQEKGEPKQEKDAPKELTLSQVTQQLKINQLEIRKVRTAISRSGKTLNLAGSLILSGIGSVALGSYLFFKNEPDAGRFFTIIGGGLGIVGYATIIRSGNLLRSTSAKDLRIGLDDKGLVMQFRF